MLKAIGFKCLKAYPFQAIGFKYQPAPLHHVLAFLSSFSLGHPGIIPRSFLILNLMRDGALLGAPIGKSVLR